MVRQHFTKYLVPQGFTRRQQMINARQGLFFF